MPDIRVTRTADQVTIRAECRAPLVLTELEAWRLMSALSMELRPPVPDDVIRAEVDSMERLMWAGVEDED